MPGGDYVPLAVEVFDSDVQFTISQFVTWSATLMPANGSNTGSRHTAPEELLIHKQLSCDQLSFSLPPNFALGYPVPQGPPFDSELLSWGTFLRTAPGNHPSPHHEPESCASAQKILSLNN